MISLPKAIQKQRNVLPKTGQITSYQAGDDGDYEAGWWRRRLNANNKTRFVLKTIAGNDVICDYATRLMWKASSQVGLYNWSAAIIAAETLVYANFSNWKLPNVFELFSIINFGTIAPTLYPLFGLFVPSGHWTSTTVFAFTGLAFYIDLSDGSIVGDYKTSPDYRVCVCREF